MCQSQYAYSYNNKTAFVWNALHAVMGKSRTRERQGCRRNYVLFSRLAFEIFFGHDLKKCKRKNDYKLIFISIFCFQIKIHTFCIK